MTSRELLIIEPCGPPEEASLARNLAMIQASGLTPTHRGLAMTARDRLTEEGAIQRAAHVQETLLQSPSDFLLCARGGYGASELLHRLDWARIQSAPARCLVGFSDVTALQSALYTKLGWPGLHAPMPGSPLWANGPHMNRLLAYLSQSLTGSLQGCVEIYPVNPKAHDGSGESGILFGGCLSVLSGLIGTPFLPADLSGHILFFEDTGESLPRVMRYWRQWLDSELLRGVPGVIFGRFTGSNETTIDEDGLMEQLAHMTPCPVYRCGQFGHIAENYPLMIGAQATFTDDQLCWMSEFQ